MVMTSTVATRSITIILVMLLSGCSDSVSYTSRATTNNSSQGNLEYFEEPISEKSQKYIAALQLSNEAVDALAEGRFSDVHNLLNDELAATISEERLAEIYTEYCNQSGVYKEHLPMQWGFTWLTEKNEKVVYSTKIVVHENFRVFYHFRFADDGEFARISGLHFKSQLNDETISDSAYSVISSK